MEISTFLHIEEDFGAKPVYSRNYSALLLPAGGSTITIDHSAEGATGYLINGCTIGSNSAGPNSFALTINNESYITFLVLAAPTSLPTTYFGAESFWKARKINLKCTDTKAVITIFYQFLFEGKKIKTVNK